MTFLNLFHLAILFLIVENVSSEVYFKKGAPHVKLSNEGILSGSLKYSREGRPYTSFEGVPYAKVPERFAESEFIKEPQWEGVLSAEKPGAACPQKMMGPVDLFLGEEDCLFLNVYVPMNNTGKKGYPVMVWIHGGGFVFGSGNAFGGPQYFMDEDVILVSINYRLGVFGFLSTGDEVVPGNQGLKDQVMALRWVQENIKNFGGNPNKVTIFGESAGGASVHFLMLSPMAKGLFHRAIAQSGSSLGPWAHTKDPRKNAVELATHLKCPTAAASPSDISSEEILTCLKGKTSKQLNKAQMGFKQSFPLNIPKPFFLPTIEPEATASSKHTPFLTQDPWSIINDKTRSLSDVPLMIGATEDEGVHMFASVVLASSDSVKSLNSNWDELSLDAMDITKFLPCPENRKLVADKIKEFYFASKDISKETFDSLTDFYSDAWISYPVHRAAIETASRGTGGSKNPVYYYQFAYKAPMSLMALVLGLEPEDDKKVGHADELMFQFDMGSLVPGTDLVKADSPEEEFSKNLIQLWVSFAKHGEPKHSWGLDSTGKPAKWNPISKKELDGQQPLKWYRLDKNPENVNIDDRVLARAALWDEIWDKHINSRLCSTGNNEKTEL